MFICDNRIVSKLLSLQRYHFAFVLPFAYVAMHNLCWSFFSGCSLVPDYPSSCSMIGYGQTSERMEGADTTNSILSEDDLFVQIYCSNPDLTFRESNLRIIHLREHPVSQQTVCKGKFRFFSLTGAIRRSSPVIVISLLIEIVAFALSTVGNAKNSTKTIVGAVLYVIAGEPCSNPFAVFAETVTVGYGAKHADFVAPWNRSDAGGGSDHVHFRCQRWGGAQQKTWARRTCGELLPVQLRVRDTCLWTCCPHTVRVMSLEFGECFKPKPDVCVLKLGIFLRCGVVHLFPDGGCNEHHTIRQAIPERGRHGAHCTRFSFF